MVTSSVRFDMECHACGATISDKAADCPYCGTSVSSPSDGPPDDHSPDADGDPEPSPSEGGPGGPPATDADDDPLGGQSTGGQPTDSGGTDDRFSDDESTTDDPLGGQSPDDQSPEHDPIDSEPDDDPGSDDQPLAGGNSPDSGESGKTRAATDWGAGEGTDESLAGEAGGGTDDRRAGGHGAGGQSAGGQQAGGQSAGGQGSSEDTQTRSEGFDPATVLSRLPLFPGAAAGFAVAVVTFGVGVVVAALIPGGDTFGQGASAFFDLHFGTSRRVTPLVFGNFEEFRPPDASLGILYLLPMVFLFTAAKAVVAFNTDETAPLPESVLAGMTLLLGYAPVTLIAYIVAPRGQFAPTTLVGALVVTMLVYPLAFGAVGGLLAGGLSGSERRVGTVYAFGALFLVFVGTFLSTFLFVDAGPDGVDVLWRLLVTLFAVAGTTVFSLGGGSVANVLPFVVVAGAFGVAGFVRSWRGDPASPLRGFAKGASMAVTYAVVAGFFLSVLPVFADAYLQEQVEMPLFATSFVDGIVGLSLNTVTQYVIAVYLSTVVYVVLVAGVAGTVAAAIRGDERDETAPETGSQTA
jgi:hypothetical protein